MQKNFNYKKYVNECSKDRRDVMISNRSIRHAEDLITEIVHIAKERICILTGSCDDMFYNKESILEEFESFIERTKGKGEIQIICECKDTKTDDHNNCKNLISFLSNKYKEQKVPESLSLYTLKDNFPIIKVQDSQKKYAIHFIVIDKNGPFRYEEHSIKEDQSTRIENSRDFLIEAKANFGNKTISKSLQEFFDKLKDNKYSSKIDIP